LFAFKLSFLQNPSRENGMNLRILAHLPQRKKAAITRFNYESLGIFYGILLFLENWVEV